MKLISFWLSALTLTTGLTAGPIYNISIDTTALIGHPAGEFYLAFQLADGSGAGDANNAAILTNFNFGGGGAPFGLAPILFGGAFGDLSAGVILIDSSFPNIFAQSFTAGSSVSFTLELTGNPDAGGIPDSFIFSILDRMLNPIPTEAGPGYDVLIQIDLDSITPAVTIFASDPARSPFAAGGPIDVGSANVTLIDTPEPGSLMLSAIALILMWRARGAASWREIGK